ncbi:MAG: TniQ family protein [Mycobacterium sp.]|nr:TniQ family protein [Mycobacterium sp.]
MRALPIRVAPTDREALDSWLEALAHRTHCAFGDLLEAVGLSAAHQQHIGSWMIRLSSTEAEMIGTATGVSSERLKRMTLSKYSGSAVRINSDTGTLNRAFPWSAGHASRFCPMCLADSGGRWQLAWRLGWAFACISHNCLLADVCVKCGTAQRRRTHINNVIPQPGRCGEPAGVSTGRSADRCHANLTTTPVVMFDADHPAIRAQRVVNTVIDAEASEFGVYEARPQHRIAVLADIRAIAGRALAYARADELQTVLPPDLAAAHRDAIARSVLPNRRVQSTVRPGLSAPAWSAAAAAGVVIALQTLENPDVASAGERLRWLVASSRDRGFAVSGTRLGWGKRTSPVLTGVQLSALGPMLKVSDQLRYRIGAPMPAAPADGGIPADRLPVVLWAQWSLRLAIPNCHQRYLAPALSVALLLVGSRIKLNDAARSINSPANGQAVSRVLQLFEKHPQWSDVRAALLRMATYLRHHDVPIDYDRRRRLDYAALLSDDAWAQICRNTATPGARTARARIARCYMFERISGLPASVAPWAVNDEGFRTQVADFPQYLTPELACELDANARAFLAGCGIETEPLTWQPPTSFLDGLALPGANPKAISIGELHDAVNAAGKKKLGNAAAELATGLDVVRHLLATHPAPREAPPEDVSWPLNHNRAYARVKTALLRDHFIKLYHHEHMPLGAIAKVFGVSSQTIARLAGDYQIVLRERRLPPITRDWLYDQYVNRGRALPDIGRDIGMSGANVARWAKIHAIPMRGRGARSQSAALAAQRFAAAAPDLIRPALTGIRGWERLQRFAEASNYANMSIAAADLGLATCTLNNQINRIERELGMTLLIRAWHERPMRLTDDGARVVRAIWAHQHGAGHS